MLSLKAGVAGFLALAIAQSAGAAMARTADSAADEVRVVVQYSDLDLATPQGAAALRDRVDRAALRVKGDVDPRDLGGAADLRRARAAAQDTANAIIEAHRGTALARAPAAPNKVHL
jgi:UrcA family protein